MGERTSYAPGTFCWSDLTTTDQEAGKRFYCELFNWEATDIPVGEGVLYTMMELDGKPVAALSLQPKQQRDAGVPPSWNSYVSVKSADETLERAKQLGATVHAPAFDVMDAGRMAVVQDPQGAFFLLWEPRSHIGAGLVNAPGALSWNELESPDLDASSEFYGALFGWKIDPIGADGPPYRMIRNGDASNGGMQPVMPPGTPPYWLVYFGAEDVQASMAKVQELGGRKLVDPIDIGMGKIAVAQDPQGAVFALFSGDLEP